MATRIGTPGNDVLQDDGAGDYLVGGRGDDFYDVIHPTTRILEFDGEGEDTVSSYADFFLPDGVEHLVLTDTYRFPTFAPVPAARLGVGNELDNVIRGNASANLLLGEDGDDVLLAAAGNDTVLGGNGHDHLNGNEGHDVLSGNEGNDNIRGGQGNDWLNGGRGDDRLFGDFGNDTLSGDRGNDTIYGGAGADHFLIGPGAGLDLIADFSSRDGDKLVMPDGIFWTMSVQGNDAVITLGNGSSVTVLGMGGVGTQGSDWIVIG